MDVTLKLTVIVIIICVVLLMSVFVFWAVLRRLIRNRRFRKLDEQRDIYRTRLLNVLISGQALHKSSDLSSRQGSTKWQAIEDVLLSFISDKNYMEEVKKLFNLLGYISYYEKQLNRNFIVRASAIDKLGKMHSGSSVDRLIEMLKDKNPEVVAVTIRALSRIGLVKGLKGILEILPHLLDKGMVSRKTIETFFLNFGNDAVPVLLQHAQHSEYPTITASLLEVLSNINAQKALPLALDLVNSPNPEIRAKALKLIGNTAGQEDRLGERIAPLLDDPVWFVRLQAAKALGNINYKKATEMLGGLLLDEKWHVRNAAATALTKFGDDSLDVFLKTLRYKDVYAKESICEEIERTDYVARLINNMVSSDNEVYRKSKEILNVLRSLKFITPLKEYMRDGIDDSIKQEIKGILDEGASA